MKQNIGLIIILIQGQRYDYNIIGWDAFMIGAYDVKCGEYWYNDYMLGWFMSYIKRSNSPERNKNYGWLDNALLATHKKIMQRNFRCYGYMSVSIIGSASIC